MRCTFNSLAKRHHSGHVGGPDPDIISGFSRTVPAFTKKNQERQAKLSQASSLALWELITDGRFESNARKLLRKSNFLFRDSVMRMQMMYMSATNGFISLENIISSSQTWRGCFLCYPFN